MEFGSYQVPVSVLTSVWIGVGLIGITLCGDAWATGNVITCAACLAVPVARHSMFGPVWPYELYVGETYPLATRPRNDC